MSGRNVLAYLCIGLNLARVPDDATAGLEVHTMAQLTGDDDPFISDRSHGFLWEWRLRRTYYL
jgi:hypothetical protein